MLMKANIFTYPRRYSFLIGIKSFEFMTLLLLAIIFTVTIGCENPAPVTVKAGPVGQQGPPVVTGGPGPEGLPGPKGIAGPGSPFGEI